MNTASSAGRPARPRKAVIVARELLVFLGFCFFTALLTWPYVTRMRDAVVDKGDPYLMAWILWWDYHATFTNPLHLFDANVFYPLKYSLAFSEHSYGLALLFFPLYFIGLRPLTVQTIALFFGFAVSGYGAFRLGRALTGSTAVGWVSGIVFAFVPYRFNMMSQVVYLFSPWMPLVFEALVLFARERSRKRAIWLGCAFFMNGLTTITWFTFTLIPFALFAAILLTRYRIWRDREFWLRAGVALTAAVVALLPFMIPYVLASRLYGFKRTIEEIKANSALPTHWLAVENRNKLWNRMGEGVFEGWKFKLFPGLLPILFSLAALLGGPRPEPLRDSVSKASAKTWLPRLDALIVALFALSLLAIGFDHTNAFYNFFDNLTSERALALLTIAIIVRLCLAYPSFLNAVRPNLIETIRSDHRSDAFWLGSILAVLGFCFSLGWNFFFYRICYQLLPMFKSMRVVTRGAMLTYLGLALLSGLGVQRLAEWISQRYPRFQMKHVFIVACVLLLLEFNSAPLRIERGDPFPDSTTLRLKQTPMRGGIVYLPAGGDNNYRYMLRAADHAKPLIVGTSGFNSPFEDKIENLTRSGQIPDELMTLLESVPTSYLVIANNVVPPDRVPEYQAFLRRQLSSSRLRFINRFDGRDDLYAVVKTEPDAKTETALPFDGSLRDWSSSIHADPVVLLGPLNLVQKLYRVHLVTSGNMPRYEPFKSDLEEITRGVIVGSDGQEQQFADNFQRFLETWMKRESFAKTFSSLDDTQFVNKLLANAGIAAQQQERQALIDALASGKETRASALLKIVDDPRLVQKEQNRSLVLLHYFAYLRRNPDDPPDGDLRGFNLWVSEQERRPNPSKLSTAFRESFEYEKFSKKY
ncbi:MAG TPA: hypothetical protein VJ749_01435 [Pyrinomonadaceae bacterium]|nr:hypothetical protein [Pyrinomonadaceae bacterium]